MRGQQSTVSPTKAPSSTPVVTGRVQQGIPVLRAPARLGPDGVAALVELTKSRCAGGPAIIDLGPVVAWTADGVAALRHADPGFTRIRWALVAPPAGIYAALADTVGLMFPCVSTATNVLTRPPGPLPHPSAAGQAIRYAHRRFDADPSSLYAARAWTAEQLDSWNLAQLTDKTLIAISELITDAAERCNSDFRLTVYLWRDNAGARMFTASVAGSLQRDNPASVGPTHATSGLHQAGICQGR